MSLALLTLSLLCAPPARAQSGYPGGSGSGGSGYPGGGYPGSSGSWVPSSSAYTDNNGLVYLRPQTGTGDTKNTYPVPDDAASWWSAVFGPNQYDGGLEYGPPSLTLYSHAGNSAQDPYQRNAYYYDPANYGGDRDDTLALPPDLLGSVTSKNKTPLSVDFIWTGPGPTPSSASFLVLTHLNALAGADYGNGGATLGVTATAMARLPDQQEQVGATAGDAGSNSAPPLNGRHLVRVTPKGNTATVIINGEVDTYTSNSLAYASWQDSPALAGSGEHGTYYYSGKGNGETIASASANVSATAGYDGRDVYITSSDVEDSFYKGAYDSQHGTDRYLHQRNADGSIQTDSVAFYGTADNNHGWNASANFVANTPGFTNPTYSWSSDFNPVAMLGVDTTQPTIVGGWFFGSSDNLPKNSTVTLNVQDADGVTASNTLGVKWHLPYEAPNPVPYLVLAGKYSLQPARVGPVSDGQTTLVQPTKPQHFDWEATRHGASVGATVGGQEEIAGGLEIVEAIAKIAKPYTDVDAEPQQETGATNGPTTWSDALSENQEIYTGGNVPSNLTGDPNGWQICKMYIFQVVHYKDKYWYADGYKSHGYDGTSQNVVYLQNIDSVYDEFQFIQYKNHDGSPYNPS